MSICLLALKEPAYDAQRNDSIFGVHLDLLVGNYQIVTKLHMHTAWFSIVIDLFGGIDLGNWNSMEYPVGRGLNSYDYLEP